MDASNARIETRLREEAKSLGFVSIGFCDADADFSDRLMPWLQEGRHGGMEWMEGRATERSGPKSLWPEAQSVIMLGMSYAPAQAHPEDSSRGIISHYAQGADYHDVIKKALKALARWLVAEAGCGVKVFVDTAPVMEKPLAARAGLGWQGKHTNLVSRDHGSWLFLGAIMTTLVLEPDAHVDDHCGSCNACQIACPTNAFPAPYQLDARRCISYLTIEHKGAIPLEFRKAMGNRIYGCDDCLLACPWNKFAKAAAAHRAFAGRAELKAPALGDLLALDDAGFRQVFAGSPIKRIGRNRMVRNAAIAAGNSGDKAVLPSLARLCDDADESVAEAAQWALAELKATG
jgi:epoxyqueuosine reductase